MNVPSPQISTRQAQPGRSTRLLPASAQVNRKARDVTSCTENSSPWPCPGDPCRRVLARRRPGGRYRKVIGLTMDDGHQTGVCLGDPATYVYV